MGVGNKVEVPPKDAEFQTLLHQTVDTCGTNLSAQHEFYSLGEQVKVAFNSDAQNNGRGFTIEYKIAS